MDVSGLSETFMFKGEAGTRKLTARSDAPCKPEDQKSVYATCHSTKAKLEKPDLVKKCRNLFNEAKT